MIHPYLRQGMYAAAQRMINTIRWRMDRCAERGELSGRIVHRIERMIEEAERHMQHDEYPEAIVKLTNAAIYLGRYMFME